jgi:hypothetical protein
MSNPVPEYPPQFSVLITLRDWAIEQAAQAARVATTDDAYAMYRAEMIDRLTAIAERTHRLAQAFAPLVPEHYPDPPPRPLSPMERATAAMRR